ncbi:MAG: ABC transporter ATP-binding protein [Planctomycetota bacterium]|nr:MAG: ABC transporter ATP-binding protein [Planctomycetota bacterium]
MGERAAGAAARSGAGRPGIELRGLYKSFGDHQVLRGLDLVVERGQTTVIVGGSGTGKSVTLKHMVGLLKPDRGRVFVDGEDITEYDSDRLVPVRRKFGYLFQSGALIGWLDVFDNVALPLRELSDLSEAEIRERVMEKLRLLQVHRAARRMPPEISGGMRKRVALARALIWDPEFVLFDEPTTGLDPILTATVDQMIIETRERTGVTSVVVSHDMQSARRIADKIIMLYQGRAIFEAPPAEFMASEHPIVRQFVRGELEGPITAELRAAERGLEAEEET